MQNGYCDTCAIAELNASTAIPMNNAMVRTRKRIISGLRGTAASLDA
jgi:hypothetical protein